MEATNLQGFRKEKFLKVVKNYSLKNKSINCKIQINTLIPGCTYTNHKGEIITPTGVLL